MFRKKNQRMISAVIIVVIVLAMVLVPILSYLM